MTIDQTARAQAEAAHEGAGMSGGGGSVASSAGGAPALFDGYLNRRLWSFLCDAALETPSRLQRKQPMLTAAARHRRRNALRDASAPSPSAPSPSAPSPSAPSPLVDHGDFEGARRANGREATYADSDDLAVEGGAWRRAAWRLSNRHGLSCALPSSASCYSASAPCCAVWI